MNKMSKSKVNETSATFALKFICSIAPFFLSNCLPARKGSMRPLISKMQGLLFIICCAWLQVHGESKENPFRRSSSSRLLDPQVLALMQHVPGVGRVKALALLQHFTSFHQLCNATPTELEPIVGQAAAQHIHNFFHKPTASGIWT